MNTAFSTTLAHSRERELRTVARRPAHLMSRVLELEGDAPPSRRAWHGFRRPSRPTRSRPTR